jgi:hypothetical protein
MSDEPTKACVRVLRFEAKVRYALWYPFDKFFSLLAFLCQYINWCIVRAAFRWLGILLTVLLIYYFVDIMINNPHPTSDVVNLVGVGMFITLFCGFFTFMSWVGVPYDEQRVIDDHIKELSGEKK